MDFVSIGIGMIGTMFLFALISDREDEETELDHGMTDSNDLIVTDFSSRYVMLSCQTCRKLKKHKEIETNLYQCTRCKRHVDLRKH